MKRSNHTFLRFCISFGFEIVKTFKTRFFQSLNIYTIKYVRNYVSKQL
jgi:hypothetical protein